MKNNRTFREEYDRFLMILKNGQEFRLTNQDRKNAMYHLMKHAYNLGNGDLGLGLERIKEEAEQEHIEIRNKYSIFSLAEDMLDSNNPAHRSLIKFFLQNDHYILQDEALKLSEEIYQAEIKKSAKELPAIGDEENKPPPIYTKELQEVKRLSNEPLTIDQIAVRISKSRSSVKRYRKILGIRTRKHRAESDT